MAGILLAASRGEAVITQIDGTTVPQSIDRIRIGLNWGESDWTDDDPTYDGTEIGPILPVEDAGITPELFQVPFTEPAGLPVYGSVTFEYIMHGGGYDNDFGWYNADDPSELFIMMGPNAVGGDYELENNADPYTDGIKTRTFDFDASYQAWLADPENTPGYHGGAIGFFLYTSEYGALRRVFYTEQELNGDGNYVHYLIYQSVTWENTYYFGFEDLFRGGDNDFEDNFFKVQGLVVPCVPDTEICDGEDNNCNGYVDEDVVPEAGDEQCNAEENQGICSAHTECMSGTWECVVDQGPTGETCNGFDDDCDGTVDDNVGSPPSEECTSAQNLGQCTAATECYAGDWRCVVTQGPEPELCDGQDNDCDGEDDNGVVPAPEDEECTPADTAGDCEASTQCVDGGWSCVRSQGPVGETCDGRDNDCDGTVDDGVGAAPSELCSAAQVEGDCTASTQCTGGAWRCVVTQGPEPELCDGRDNDCDGYLDNGVVPTLADERCTAVDNEGECSAATECVNGAWACVPSQLPAPETCDGLDNDCDGAIDDAVGDPPSELCNPAQSQGDCTAVTSCTGGAWRCVVVQGPVAEICDGRDNDCSGTADNGVVPGPADEQCTVAANQGECAASTQCVGGGWQCVPSQGPVPEVCDGRDNDCDGNIDDDVGSPPSEECSPAQSAGECSASTQCTGGAWRCVVSQGPVAEVCDGLDNDCNGVADDGVVPTTDVCTAADTEGECAASTRCVGGGWQCVQSQGPVAEICDGRDNDCDGTVDDDVGPPPSEVCTNAQTAGECEASTQCTGGAWRCVVTQGPVAEVCDGQDNDCNGIADDGVVPTTELCTAADTAGECAASTRCVEGNWQCVQSQGPVAEACDGRDNDCDGTVDEDIGAPPSEVCTNAQTAGECEASTQCTGGAWRCVVSQGPEAEVCDGQDNDCNGLVDDGLVPSAELCTETDTQGECAAATRCVSGTWQCVQSQGPVAELCDGRDNDCDGTIDEDIGAPPSEVCTNAQTAGECEASTQCTGGAWRCVVSQGPVAEVCDGHDNDCNGTVDDGLVATTDLCTADQRVGECDATTECRSGTWQCVQSPQATAELCDGRDNDCNGEIDDLAPGTTPSEDECTAAQNAGECSAATQCTGGAWRCVVSQGPVPELCDGKDNDCTGVVDDNLVPPSTIDCTPQNVGLCLYEPGCNGTEWVCEEKVGPATEVCDGRDNDCDTLVDLDDPDFADVLIGTECEPSVSGLPVCGEPIYACVNGVRVCQGFTIGEVELCDGLDNDCDGETDEDPDGDGPEQLPGVGLNCGSSVGECEPGTTVCVEGRFDCQPVQGPVDELCDGLDNDCDGQADENPDSLPGMGEPCDHNGCPGLVVCRNGAPLCDFDTQDEVCDGLDNDCDGQIDNNLSWVGTSCNTELTQTVSDSGNQGQCQAGQWQCVETEAGAERICAGEIGPVEEVCNGLDDDCDTYIDNDPDGEGPEELSGEFEEETVYVGIACGDEEACGEGAYVCENGEMRCDGTVAATSEVCDGTDNDCDGTIDEADDLVDETGAPCGSVLPPCEPGVYECVDGALLCVGATEGTEEICDGLDNDCDGQVDEPPPAEGGVGQFEGEGEPCAPEGLDGELMSLPLPEESVCQAGIVRCMNGDLMCVGAIGPNTIELCNLIDDNCNGEVDDEAVCPPEHVCHEGVCVAPCQTGEFPCPGGFFCVRGYCEPIEETNGAAGSTGEGGGAGASGVMEGWECLQACRERAEDCATDLDESDLEQACTELCAPAVLGGASRDTLDCVADAKCEDVLAALAGGSVCGLERVESSGGGAGGGAGRQGATEGGTQGMNDTGGTGAPAEGNPQAGVDENHYGMATGGGGCRCHLGARPARFAGLAFLTALVLIPMRRRRVRVAVETREVGR